MKVVLFFKFSIQIIHLILQKLENSKKNSNITHWIMSYLLLKFTYIFQIETINLMVHLRFVNEF